MPILVDGTPTFIIPVFQQTGFIVQYKPFASFYQWTDFLDFTDFDSRMTAIEASIPADLAATIDAIITELGTIGVAAVTAQAAADLAQAQAAAVQSNLDSTNINVTAAAAAAAAAQTTANTGVTNAATAQAAAVAAQATANAASTPATLPRRILLMSEAQEVTAGTEVRLIDGTYPFAAGKYTNTQNAVIQHLFTCRAGAHLVVSILSSKSSANGIVTVYLDGTLVITQETYQVAVDKAFIFGATLGAIVAGDHTIEFKCLTKNASSSGYIMFINSVKLTVT